MARRPLTSHNTVVKCQQSERPQPESRIMRCNASLRVRLLKFISGKSASAGPCHCSCPCGILPICAPRHLANSASYRWKSGPLLSSEREHQDRPIKQHTMSNVSLFHCVKIGNRHCNIAIAALFTGRLHGNSTKGTHADKSCAIAWRQPFIFEHQSL